MQKDKIGLQEAARLMSKLWALRNLSIGVAKVLEEREEVATPGFIIRGGTSEVLYGIVAKGVVA